MKSATDYQQLEHRDHIYKVPDTYLGSCSRNPINKIVFDSRIGQMVSMEMDIPEGLERTFLEIASNAGDNVIKSRINNIDAGKIYFWMDQTTIRVRNEGLSIPIEIHPAANVWVPQLIFGALLTSDNYPDNNKIRMGAGRNGYGAKLTNIFSKYFEIEIGDSIHNLSYRQVWLDNMTQISEPEIKQYEGASYVDITYVIDFERFGYHEQAYTELIQALYHRYALDFSMTCEVPIMFNDVEYNMSNILDYAQLYIPQTNAIDIKGQTNKVQYKFNGELRVVVGEYKIAILDTPDNGAHFSFVNGIPTFDGGVHVNEVYNAVKDIFITKLKPQIDNYNSKVSKTGKKINIGINDIRQHISIVASFKLPNPEFQGQAKNVLKFPKPSITIPKSAKEKMFNWKVADRLLSLLESKVGGLIPKTHKKTKYLKNIGKGEDANFAGTDKSEQCILCLVEGNSASAYPARLFENILGSNFRDTIGIEPLRGKLLNTMNANKIDIFSNKVIARINEVMGLDPKLDYMNIEDLIKLRYGYILILSDADVDGIHITGLVVNYLTQMYPGLVKHGRLMSRRTPIVRITHKRTGEMIKFFSLYEFNEWSSRVNTKEFEDPEYFKGLGSSDREVIAMDAKDPTNFVFSYDDMTADMLRLAFDKSLADTRKQWIESYDPKVNRPQTGVSNVSISNFINEELIEFSLDDLQRSIPSEIDGLKISQRKILETAFRHWGSKSETQLLKKDLKRYKTGRWANFASEQTNYVHGEACLASTITKMAQDFIGTNNMPLFKLKSEFGTRKRGGKDAGDSRYTYSRPYEYLEYIFPKVDFPLLNEQYDENIKIEPEFFLPIVPIHVINGVLGIGTGHSSFIPKFNPLHVINWLKAKLNNQQLPDLIPWYRSFTGTIEISNRWHLDDIDEEGFEKEDIIDDDQDNIKNHPNQTTLNREGYSRIIIKGCFKQEKNGLLVITELPVGRWTHDYIVWLHKLREQKEIRDITDHCTAEKVNIEIKGFKKIANHKTLRLIKSYPMTNMVLLDCNRKPKHFTDIYQLMSHFYLIRLHFYSLRKDLFRNRLLAKIKEATEKQDFIQAKISGRLVIDKRAKKDIILDIQKLGLKEAYLQKIKIYDFTQDAIDKLQADISGYQAELQNLEQVSAEELWYSDLIKLEEQLKKLKIYN